MSEPNGSPPSSSRRRWECSCREYSGGTGLRGHEGKLLVDAEGAASDSADGIAGREVAEEFAAVVVHAEAGANDDLVVEYLGLPCRAHPGADAPLAAGERRGADAQVPLVLLPAMIKPGLAMVSWTCAVAVEVGIEVEDAALLFGKAAVPVVAHAGGSERVGVIWNLS